MRNNCTEDFAEVGLLTNVEQVSRYELQKVGSKGYSKNAHPKSNQCPPIFLPAVHPVMDTYG